MRRCLRDLTFSRFDTIPACNKHTHSETQIHRHSDSICRTSSNINSWVLWWKNYENRPESDKVIFKIIILTLSRHRRSFCVFCICSNLKVPFLHEQVLDLFVNVMIKLTYCNDYEVQYSKFIWMCCLRYHLAIRQPWLVYRETCVETQLTRSLPET